MLVFKPNQKKFRAAPHLCVCEKCEVEIGSCEIFDDYELECNDLKGNVSRSDSLNKPEQFNVNNMEITGSFGSILPSESSTEPLWFVFISEECVATESMVDGFGHEIKETEVFLKCNYMEKIKGNKKGYLYKKMDDTVFLYKDFILMPFVQFVEGKKSFFISNDDYNQCLLFKDYYP